MKGKISKIRRAVGGVWDLNEFPVSIREYNFLQVNNENKTRTNRGDSSRVSVEKKSQ